MKKNPDHAKYITTTKFNKFLGEIFDAKLEKAKLATNTDLASLNNVLLKRKKKERLKTYDSKK